MRFFGRKKTTDADEPLIEESADKASGDAGSSWFSRLSKGLGRTGAGFVSGLGSILSGRPVIDDELIEALAEEPTYITEGGLKFSKTKIRVWFDQYQRVSQVYTINKSVDFKGVQIEDDISKFRNIFGKTTMENTISASRS